MKRTYKVLGIALLVFAFIQPILVLGSVPAGSLDRFIDEQIKQRKIPGLSVAVIRDGKVIYRSAR